MALSGEYRKASLTNKSNAEPTTVMNCNGLRVNCGGSIPTYNQTITASMNASQDVKEVGAEILLPLLADLPFAKNLDLSLAGRFTNYSTSGTVYTWKIGGNWALNSDLHFRVARSRDIRAPDLFALFSPTTTTPSGLVDLHTGVSTAVIVQAHGNPNLVPEVASVLTAGLVYKPGWLRNFNLSVDYYNIRMSNAITTANGTDPLIQQQCEQSNGTSPYCALLVRPNGFSDHSAANFPTTVYSQGLNAAKQWTSGVDVEANYNFDLARIAAAAPGNLALRLLFSAQPTFNTQTVIGGPIAHAAGVVGLSKYRVNLNAIYTLNDLTMTTSIRWQSVETPYDPATIVYNVPNTPAVTYVDLAFSYRMKVGGSEFSPYFSIRNLFDRDAPIVGGPPGSPGLVYAGATGYDIVGRYFTAGVRGKF
jgi:iron complex outermembrane recepter protein